MKVPHQGEKLLGPEGSGSGLQQVLFRSFQEPPIHPLPLTFAYGELPNSKLLLLLPGIRSSSGLLLPSGQTWGVADKTGAGWGGGGEVGAYGARSVLGHQTAPSPPHPTPYCHWPHISILRLFLLCLMGLTNTLTKVLLSSLSLSNILMKCF